MILVNQDGNATKPMVGVCFERMDCSDTRNDGDRLAAPRKMKVIEDRDRI
jgi:hypothetical protein